MRTRAVFKGWLVAMVLCCGAYAASAAGQAQAVVIGPVLGGAPEVPEAELLVSELNCVACHSAAENDPLRLSSRKSPVLGKTGLRLTPQYLRRFLNDPVAYNPGTTMPDLLHHLAGAEKSDAVEALVHFLTSEQDTTKAADVGAEDFQVRQGRTLYHTIGCVACHEPETSPDAAPGITPEDPRLQRFDPSLTV
ncbi:MAG TPA: hypothetical protein VGR78_11350, partial [Verrucomicrobiae bacterium]|nr:hypothetical protein [Verrucomicrobiae bacterium]